MVTAVHLRDPTAMNGQGTKSGKIFFNSYWWIRSLEMWLSNREQSTLLKVIRATAVFVSSKFPYYRR